MSGRWKPALWWIWPPVVLGMLALQFWFPELGTGVLHDTYSPTAEGQRAFYRLVQEQGGWASRNQQPIARAISHWDLEPTLCILGPERWPTHQEWEAILGWVEQGGQLVFACRGFEEQKIPILDIRYIPRETYKEPDDSLPPKTRLVDTREIAWWTDGRLLAPTREVLVEYDGTVQVVSGTHGRGRFLVSASSLVFSNQLLTYGDNPVLAFRLLEAAGPLDGVTFDESLNMTGTPKAVGLLLDSDFRPLTFQLILVLLLYGWWNCRRFGPLLRPASGARQNFVDHTDALGVAYWTCRDGGRVLRAYLKNLKSLLRTEGAADQSGRLPAVARLSGLSVSEIRTVLSAAEATAASPKVPRRIAAAHLRRLAEIRAGMASSRP